MSFISFTDFSGSNEKILFSIEVRDSTLDEEITYQKWTASHIIVELKREEKINKDGYEGVRLEYVGSKPENGDKGFNTIIINNGIYSYSLHFPTLDFSLINQILSTFKFLN